MSENAGIQKLLQAEDEAAEIINKARADRNKKMNAAETEAQKEIDAYRTKLDKEFQDEQDQKDDSSDDFAKQLKVKTQQEITKMRAGFDASKTDVVALLLYQVTAVDLTVSDASKQAMLKFVGEQ